MRAALYVRLSEETETTTSPERQRDAARKYAESRGWTVVDTYEDIDVSATHRRLDRPALDRLRADAVAKRVDVVVVYRLDRLARNVLDSLTLLEEWRQLGVAVASTSEGIDATTPVGKAMFTLVAVFAEMEAAAISARVTASIERLRHDGRFAGGTVPYGYVPAPLEHGVGRRLVVEPDEAAIIREIADRLLAGESSYRIAHDLNERGVPSPRSESRKVARMSSEERHAAGVTIEGASAGTWRTNSIQRLVTGDHVLGRQVHQGTPVVDARGLPREVWTPILTAPTVAVLRDLLAPTQKHTRRVRAARVLSGLVRCAGCGSKMYVHTSNKTPSYACVTRSKGATCSVSPRISCAALEPYVIDTALDALGDLETTETVLLDDLPAAGLEYQETERAIKETSEAMTKPGADFAALGTRMAALHAHRAELAERGAQVSALSVVRPTGRTWRQEWENLADDDARRRFLSEWVTSVQIGPTINRAIKFNPARVVVNFVDL